MATSVHNHWPTEPVEVYLRDWLGEFDVENPTGYCSAAVERLTGVHRTSWQRWVAQGWMNDKAADRVATRLGGLHEHFWPEWVDAVEVTDADIAWIEAWLKGQVA